MFAGKKTPEASNNGIDADSAENESKATVAETLMTRLLPRTTHALYVGSTANARLHLTSILEALWNDRTIKSIGDGSWCMGSGNGSETSPSLRAMLIGPVWEPMFADMLRENGLPIEQQWPECGYYLDIALVDGEHKLDVEVDGRQHRILPSQRAKDIVRDYRLKANGWRVLRIDVSDIIADSSSCVDRVIATWRNITEGGTFT